MYITWGKSNHFLGFPIYIIKVLTFLEGWLVVCSYHDHRIYSIVPIIRVLCLRHKGNWWLSFLFRMKIIPSEATVSLLNLLHKV